MITGKGSIWKMLALFVLALVAVLDLIFCAQNKVVMWINGIAIFCSIGYVVYTLYKIWKTKINNLKQRL